MSLGKLFQSFIPVNIKVGIPLQSTLGNKNAFWLDLVEYECDKFMVWNWSLRYKGALSWTILCIWFNLSWPTLFSTFNHPTSQSSLYPMWHLQYYLTQTWPFCSDKSAVSFSEYLLMLNTNCYMHNQIDIVLKVNTEFSQWIYQELMHACT